MYTDTPFIFLNEVISAITMVLGVKGQTQKKLPMKIFKEREPSLSNVAMGTPVLPNLVPGLITQ